MVACQDPQASTPSRSEKPPRDVADHCAVGPSAVESICPDSNRVVMPLERLNHELQSIPASQLDQQGAAKADCQQLGQGTASGIHRTKDATGIGCQHLPNNDRKHWTLIQQNEASKASVVEADSSNHRTLPDETCPTWSDSSNGSAACQPTASENRLGGENSGAPPTPPCFGQTIATERHLIATCHDNYSEAVSIPFVIPVDEQAKLAAWQRIILIGLAVPVAVVLGVAYWLNPYDEAGRPRRWGTHQQLGLPPCSFQRLTGLRCPTCGLTTSFSLFMHGDWRAAWTAHPAGPVLVVGSALLACWFLAAGIAGQKLGLPSWNLLGSLAASCILLLTLGCWLVRLVLNWW